MEFKGRIFKVNPNQRATSAPWFEVLKWLVTFGCKGSTHKVVDVITPVHVNCRSAVKYEVSTGFHICKHCVQIINDHDTTCPHCGEGQ